ncbi:ribonuclease P protein subunit p21-like [Daphnia pulicaria]|uniref:ribonuclease P protein subunit p21-like n=1 Tax=Daphnia pulicaria TaxID=35523 RepID=UPI001EECAB11|nr:ribonuclease P protein subunit p21-like [Daphnia pulicaria]
MYFAATNGAPYFISKMNMSGKKTNTSGSDGFQRLNFLYQASIVALNAVPHCPQITSVFGKNMISIGKKLQLKLDHSVKRTICKGCKVLLIPGKSVEVKIKQIPASRKRKSRCGNQRKIQEWKCMFCSCVKQFVLNPGYSLWAEQNMDST